MSVTPDERKDGQTDRQTTYFSVADCAISWSGGTKSCNFPTLGYNFFDKIDYFPNRLLAQILCIRGRNFSDKKIFCQFFKLREGAIVLLPFSDTAPLIESVYTLIISFTVF